MTTTNLSTNSYHEWGTLAYADVTKGRVVAEDKGLIEVAYVSEETAYVQEKDTGIINVAFASTEAVQTASTTADATNGAKKTLSYDKTKTSEENQTIAKITGELSVAAETGEVSESLKTAGYVAVVNKVGYTTLQGAVLAANAGDTVSLLDDITINYSSTTAAKTVDYTWTKDTGGYRHSYVAIYIDKNITINGNNHTLTTSCTGNYNASIGIDVSNVTLTINNLDITTTNMSNMILGEKASKANIVINDSTFTSASYVIKSCDNADNINLTLNNVTTIGYNALNIRSNNSTINITDSTLRGINTAGESKWNDYATIVIDGDSYSCGSKNAHGINNTITITNSRVTADAPSGNSQKWLGIQYGASNNTISADGSSIIASPSNWSLHEIDSSKANSNAVTVNGITYNDITPTHD